METKITYPVILTTASFLKETGLFILPMNIETNTIVTITAPVCEVLFREFWKVMVKNNQSFTVSLVTHKGNADLFSSTPVAAYVERAVVPRRVDSIAEELYVYLKNATNKEELVEKNVHIVFFEQIKPSFRAKLEQFVNSFTAMVARISCSKASSGKEYKLV